MSVCIGCGYSHVCSNQSNKEKGCMFQKKFQALPETVACTNCEDGYRSNGFRCMTCRGSGLVLPVNNTVH